MLTSYQAQSILLSREVLNMNHLSIFIFLNILMHKNYNIPESFLDGAQNILLVCLCAVIIIRNMAQLKILPNG